MSVGPLSEEVCFNQRLLMREGPVDDPVPDDRDWRDTHAGTLPRLDGNGGVRQIAFVEGDAVLPEPGLERMAVRASGCGVDGEGGCAVERAIFLVSSM
jgi:hypothetical protein